MPDLTPEGDAALALSHDVVRRIAAKAGRDGREDATALAILRHRSPALACLRLRAQEGI